MTPVTSRPADVDAAVAANAVPPPAQLGRSDPQLARRASLVAAVLIGLSGCVNLDSAYERPVAPVPAAFPRVATDAADAATATSAAADSTSVADLAWPALYTDERLRRLIALALRDNRDLRIAALAVEQARAQAQVRDADRWPTVNAGLSGSRQPTASGGSTQVYSAGVQVTAYELDVFGRLRGLSDSAAQQLLATAEARKAVQISLVAAVAATHLALAADDALLAVTQQALATREDGLRLVKLRVDQGASSELDLRQAESLRASARVSLAQTRRQRALDENTLVLLLGRDLPEDLPPAQPLPTEAPRTLPVGLPAEVLLRRPDVRQAERQLQAAHANIAVARAAFFPRITLTGSAGVVSPDLAGLFKAGNLAWSFVPQLLQPLFDAGRNDANLSLAKVNRELAVAQYERTIQTAFREVSDTLAGRATLYEQHAAQRALVEAETARQALVDLRYRHGAANHLELLDAQRSLLAAQLGLVQVQAQVAQNLTTLYKVLGGGWTPATDLRTSTEP
jgi:outer membrane protein, multidrug efflux system